MGYGVLQHCTKEISDGGFIVLACPLHPCDDASTELSWAGCVASYTVLLFFFKVIHGFIVAAGMRNILG